MAVFNSIVANRVHPGISYSSTNMVYDWEGKEPICYRMYIDEKKSLEDIMEYMKTEYNFAPRYLSSPLQALQNHYGTLR